MANPNNWKQHSEIKPEFTDYTVAGGKEGEVRAAISRLVYEEKRADIELRRHLKGYGRPLKLESVIRCGYPTKRERNEDIPSHRGVPHSNFLKRFKIVERLVGTGFGDLVWVAKVYVLHATRGWKLYA